MTPPQCRGFSLYGYKKIRALPLFQYESMNEYIPNDNLIAFF